MLRKYVSGVNRPRQHYIARYKLESLDVKVIINGEEYADLPEAITVAKLLEHLSLPRKKIAVERNLEVVSKSTFDEVTLQDGDRIEIIHFIGGG